jgi:molecular chaperone DnaK (HSP70)
LLGDGLSIGLEFGTDALFVAVSVGGNAELIEGPEGGGFMPAVVGYDAGGQLSAGQGTLADTSWLGAAALAAGEPEIDRRGADLSTRLSCLLNEAHRRLIAILGKSITGAVLVVPGTLPMEHRAALLAASQAAGIEILRVLPGIETAARSDVLDAATMAENMSQAG